MRFALKVKTDDGAEDVLPFPSNQTSFIVGRHGDLQIDNPTVSRQHVQIEVENDVLWVTNLPDKDTRLASGQRLVGRHQWPPDEALRLGDVLIWAMIVQAPQDVDEGFNQLKKQIHELLLDRLQPRTRAQLEQNDEVRSEEVEQNIRRILVERSLDAVTAQRLHKELMDDVLGLGPLEDALKDDSISEVMVVDKNHVYVERKGQLELLDRRFASNAAIKHVIDRIVRPLGRRIDESSPMVDGRLRDGSRVNAVIPPLALRGPCITIRKFAKNALGMAELIEKGSISPQMARFLELSVRSHKNIIVSGGTGSGKTTLLNILSSFIDGKERIVTIEDAAELNLRQEHVVGLETRPPNLEGKGAYTIRDLLRNALRMRPDRIVVGECRGAEAADMLQAMNTGHDGSLTTLHSNSPSEAVTRLESMILMSGSADMPLESIRQQVANAVHVIVQQARLSDGSRKVTHIAEVVGIDDMGAIVTQDLFRFVETEGSIPDAIKGEFRRTGWIPHFYGELLVKGLARPDEFL